MALLILFTFDGPLLIIDDMKYDNYTCIIVIRNALCTYDG